MLTQEMKEILSSSKGTGWVLEPQAKRFLSLAGLEVPQFFLAPKVDEALRFAKEIGYPVVGKVVSPKVIHKSEKNGVEVGIDCERKLTEAFDRFSKIEGFVGMLIEEMVSGIELIVGAKNDLQFGPVILFGMGGVWVEIYRDVVLRMAPLGQKDIDSMMRCLKARALLEGFRGARPVNLQKLSRMLMTFSNLAMDLQNDMESIDLNPVICSAERCIVADARIMVRQS
ncbi:MAG TPA: acetate--CoA ligase family protein [Thermodesulfobacteriota bacterium]|nr:acetate--CoA ligase family protein [Thermodesulfobacteriota bacterium]